MKKTSPFHNFKFPFQLFSSWRCFRTYYHGMASCITVKTAHKSGSGEWQKTKTLIIPTSTRKQWLCKSLSPPLPPSLCLGFQDPRSPTFCVTNCLALFSVQFWFAWPPVSLRKCPKANLAEAGWILEFGQLNQTNAIFSMASSHTQVAMLNFPMGISHS